MRVLLVLRGAPASGKSTWVEKNKLNAYAISSDKIRLMYAAPRMNADGSTYISQRNNKIVWKTFMDMLEYRMSNGDFTVLDATHCSESDFNKYYELVKKYRYKVYCIDFTDISLEDCKRNNALREEYKRVPEEVIDKYFEKLQNSSIPSWVTVLKPNEYNHIWRYFVDIDMTEYEKIIFVGDVHGCYDALIKALDGGVKENIFYVFTGDLLDRGPQNAEVLKFALENYTK